MGIFSTQVTSRSQQLNPCSCSMYSKCSCNSEVDVMFSEDKENGPGGGGCWASIPRMLKREGENELVFITAQNCSAPQNPGGHHALKPRCEWRPLAFCREQPEYLYLAQSLVAYCLLFGYLMWKYTSNLGGTQTTGRQDPTSHYGHQRKYIFPLPHSLDVDKSQSQPTSALAQNSTSKTGT